MKKCQCYKLVQTNQITHTQFVKKKKTYLR
jgi:hypothetical protein